MFKTAFVMLAAVAATTIDTVTKKVFFDVEIDSQPAGRIVMGLFGDAVPKTADNVAQICEGKEGKPLWFKDSIFHRIIPGFMAQGGDTTSFNGMGGQSIYGSKFADENFTLKHTKPYLLSMANSGPNTNGSQFFITFAATSWLDGRHVVFGEVIDGVDVVKALEKIGSQSGTTSKPAKIVNSGILEE